MELTKHERLEQSKCIQDLVVSLRVMQSDITQYDSMIQDGKDYINEIVKQKAVIIKALKENKLYLKKLCQQ